MFHKILSVVIALLFAAGFVITMAIGGCDMPVATMSGSVPMACHWGFIAVSVILLVGVVLAAVTSFLKTREARRFAALALGLVALAAAWIPSPWAVGVCSWEGSAMCCRELAEPGAGAEELAWCAATMDCHISALATWAVALLVVICAIVLAVKAEPTTDEGHRRPRFDEDTITLPELSDTSLSPAAEDVDGTAITEETAATHSTRDSQDYPGTE